ncbi:hypothetical protein L596_015930 [Steinernema carpocapsae]|uniref:G-protein coupled receptors family 1 profile domain-containing protein n=1 Tax=Steinernema carpocapsae TaxID=34508 RepID=A0A4U5NHG9_STECR|nr:hypothetical protein L596_015930 [Steinernema carpocapsae]
MLSYLWLDLHPAVTVFRWCIFAISVTGNVFIIFLIFKTKKVRKEKFNLLIVLLAVGDIVLEFKLVNFKFVFVVDGTDKTIVRLWRIRIIKID